MGTLPGIAREVIAAAPLLTPTMRVAGVDGPVPFRLKVTSMGKVGWWSDERGYRYVDRHPLTGAPWPAIPLTLLTLAHSALTAAGLSPAVEAFDTCLVNVYKAPDGRLGLHIDKTEADLSHPIVSISVGAPCLFSIELGGVAREVVIESGDVIVMAGEARRARHSVVRLLEPSLWSPRPPMAEGVRLNFTLRTAL